MLHDQTFDSGNLSSFMNLKPRVEEIISINKKKICNHPSVLICDDEQFNLICLSRLL